MKIRKTFKIKRYRVIPYDCKDFKVKDFKTKDRALGYIAHMGFNNSVGGLMYYTVSSCYSFYNEMEWRIWYEYIGNRCCIRLIPLYKHKIKCKVSKRTKYNFSNKNK